MAAPVTIRNLRDNYVEQAKPNKVFANLKRLHMSAASGSQKYTYIYFGKPWPSGTNIMSAKLRLWNEGNWGGSVTITAQRLSQSWAASRLTWNNRPGVTGATVSRTMSGVSDETMWEIDIAPLLQAVSNGAPWYGIRLTVNGGSVRKFFSSNAPRAARRPQVVVQWSDAPEAPENLSPGGNRVITGSHPLLSYTFTDVAGDTSLDAQQIQLASSETGFGTPLMDTGWIIADAPEYDLNTSSYSGLATGGTVWWRARVRDGAGLQSPWSEPTSFRRAPKGVLNITSMGTKVLYTNLAVNPFGNVTTSGVFVEGPVGMPGSGGGGGGFGTGGFGTGTFGGITSGSGEVISTPSYGLLAVNGGSAAAQYLGSRANVTAGKRYSIQAIGGVTNASIQGRFRMQWLNSSGSVIGNIVRDSYMSPQELGLLRAEKLNVVAPTGATQLVAGFEVASLPSGVGLFLSSLLVTEGVTLATKAVFDGASVNPGFTYAWTGTPHNSPSTMSGYFVEDTSPPVFWTFTGQSQKAYRVQIFDITDGAWNEIYDTGKVTSTSNSIDTPDNLLKKLNGQYRVYVTIWDDLLREKVGNDPIEVQQWLNFVYIAPTSVTPPENLTATQQNPWPWVQLNFTRATPPDSFAVFRNDEMIENNIDPATLHAGGNSYQYTDRKVTPRVTHSYRVVANVNRKDSQPSETVTVKTVPATSWLMEPDTRNPVVLTKSAARPGSVVEAENRSMQQLHQPIGGGSPVLVSQYVSGYEGRVEAVLADGVIPGLTAQTMIGRIKYWRRNPGMVLLLYLVNEVLEIVPYDITYRARAKSGGEVLYDISFSFFEVV